MTDDKFEGYLPTLGHQAKFWLILLGLWMALSSPFILMTWVIARTMG